MRLKVVNVFLAIAVIVLFTINNLTSGDTDTKGTPEQDNAGGGQHDEMSILDPVNLQLHNMSDGFANISEKIPLISDEKKPKVDGEPEEVNTQREEQKDSLATFFILLVLVVAILLVHVLIVTEIHFMPESLAIVLLGAAIGFLLSYSRFDWREVETFNPNFFFLVLLPPIIFESGYNLHKGNFFANIIPILTFAIFGTLISAFVIGGSVYILGQADLIYRLTPGESFAFGSLISAVDPVATLAIFQALKVDGQVYMLVFGESMLNDAIAIVLTATCLELESSSLTGAEALVAGLHRFIAMFFVSALLGTAVGLISALLFKHVDFRKTPSLELALMFVFAYLPYGFAESCSLSGIMAILFCSITMSQYTHFNVSPITQITLQQTFRTISFVAETCTFAYLGLALFTIKLVFQPAFLVWSLILLFVSRACAIFPLSHVINKVRRSQISLKNQVIMWFSGMRGAVAFALVLHMELANKETKQMLLTTTLFILLFTITFMGGSTLPLLKVLPSFFPTTERHKPRKRKSRKERNTRTTRVRRSSPVLLSKTQEMVNFDNSEHFTTTEWEEDGRWTRSTTNRTNVFTQLNERVMRPLFVRRFTQQERAENRQRFQNFASEAIKQTGDATSAGASRNGSSSDELFPPSASGQPLLPR